MPYFSYTYYVELQVPEINAYASVKIQAMTPKLHHSRNINIFCYHCVEYIKFHNLAKFFHQWSKNNKFMEGVTRHPLDAKASKKPCQIELTN